MAKNVEEMTDWEIADSCIKIDLRTLALSGMETDRLVNRTVLAVLCVSATGLAFAEAYRSVVIQEKEIFASGLEERIAKLEAGGSEIEKNMAAQSKDDLARVRSAMDRLQSQTVDQMLQEVVLGIMDRQNKQFFELASRFSSMIGDADEYTQDEKEGHAWIRKMLET